MPPPTPAPSASEPRGETVAPAPTVAALIRGIVDNERERQAAASDHNAAALTLDQCRMHREKLERELFKHPDVENGRTFVIEEPGRQPLVVILYAAAVDVRPAEKLTIQG